MRWSRVWIFADDKSRNLARLLFGRLSNIIWNEKTASCQKKRLGFGNEKPKAAFSIKTSYAQSGNRLVSRNHKDFKAEWPDVRMPYD